MVRAGAEGGRSQGRGLRATGRGTGTAAGGGAGGSSWPGEAGDLKDQGRSTQREVEGLKGTSGGGAEELADFG